MAYKNNYDKSNNDKSNNDKSRAAHTDNTHMNKGKANSGKKAPVKKSGPQLPPGWFLMSKETLTVRDLKNLFPEQEDVEIWEEAGVLEIVLGEKMSLDIEEMDLPKRAEDRQYFEDRNIVSIFYLSFKAEAYDLAKPLMQKIVNTYDCEICGDTNDFTPVIKKNN